MTYSIEEKAVFNRMILVIDEIAGTSVPYETINLKHLGPLRVWLTKAVEDSDLNNLNKPLEKEDNPLPFFCPKCHSTNIGTMPSGTYCKDCRYTGENVSIKIVDTIGETDESMSVRFRNCLNEAHSILISAVRMAGDYSNGDVINIAKSLFAAGYG